MQFLFMKKEIWSPVKNYEGYYQVSSYGRVRSADRVIIDSDGVKRLLKGKILKPAKNNNGYFLCGLCKNGQMKYVLIHRLVAEAFIPNPSNLPEVNHKDENKTNNSVFLKKDGSVDLGKSNLEWCTRSYNINYGTRNKQVAEKRLNSPKFSKPVLQIDINTGRVISEYPSVMEAARKLNINNGGISMCCLRKRKTYKRFKWKYA